MKRYVPTLLFLIVLTPSIAFASWWNPFSWNWTALLHGNKNNAEVLSEKEIKLISQPGISKEIDLIPTNTTPAPDLKISKPINPPVIVKTVSEKNIPTQVLTNIDTSPQQVVLKPDDNDQSELSAMEQVNKKNERLLKEYNDEVYTINQQIINIKKQYYIDVAEIQSQPIPLEFKNGRIDKLTTDNNIKISQLNLQIDELTNDYNSKINQLNN